MVSISISSSLDLSFKSFVQDGGKHGVQFGGGLGLQALQRVQPGHDPALLGERSAI